MSSRSGVCLVISAGLWALSPPSSAVAQSVTEVSGSNVKLDCGMMAGVAKAMKGRLCTTEKIAGREVEVCPAAFEVEDVTESSASAKIVGGDPQRVQVGFKARFASGLKRPEPAQASAPSQTPVSPGTQRAADTKDAAPTEPPKRDSRGQAPGSGSAASLLSQADRLYDAGDLARAQAKYLEFVERFPSNASSEYALGMAEGCRQKIASQASEILATADAAAKAAADAEKRAALARLLAGARLKLDLGRPDEALVPIEEAVALDSADPEVQALAAEVVSAVKTARELESRRLESSRLLGDARAEMASGRYREARVLLRRSLDRDPANNTAQDLAAELRSKTVPSGEQWSEPRTGLRFRRVAAGSFSMGCSPRDEACLADERPLHRVRISRDYYVAETETTNAQYDRCRTARGCGGDVAGSARASSQRALEPIAGLSWSEAEQFCEWLGGRLPTEAEWEYSAKGGDDARIFPWGSAEPVCRAGAGNGARFRGDRCARDVPENSSPVAVGSYGRSPFGLYDLAGNVAEWVSDWYRSSYESGTITDPTGPSTGTVRSARGGSWASARDGLRVSYRDRRRPDDRDSRVGFRCALGVEPNGEEAL
jgi:formylglycine-generating enzyme required for sulfatase activity